MIEKGYDQFLGITRKFYILKLKFYLNFFVYFLSTSDISPQKSDFPNYVNLKWL